MPVEYWRVLEVLADESGRPMTALAETISMRLPTLSKLIDRMVADALVQRAPDPSDLRRVLADREQGLIDRGGPESDASGRTGIGRGRRVNGTLVR